MVQYYTEFMVDYEWYDFLLASSFESGKSSQKTYHTKNSMPPKRKKASKSTRNERNVYVLVHESINHGMNYRVGKEIVGVFDTKAAAVASSGSIESSFGAFDDVIEELFVENHEDNRDDPPVDGVLIQLGSEDSGEGDIERLLIEKCPLKSMPPSNAGKKKIVKKRKVIRDLSDDFENYEENPL